jgi:pyrroline-5-carboxylate reductase
MPGAAQQQRTIGILGVGHLGASLARGFLRAGVPGARIVLSPRGAAVAGLAAEGCRMARDNDDLAAACDVVLVCVRPDQAAEVLGALRFRAGQVVISTMAAVPLTALGALVGPARVVRAMPMTAAALCASPTALHPADEDAEEVLALVGPVLPVADEAALDVSTAGSVLYTFARLAVGLTASWLTRAGFAPDAAQAHAIANLDAAAQMLRAHPAAGVETLATPGGVAEAAIGAAEAHGLPAAWDAAFDSALERIRLMASRAAG